MSGAHAQPDLCSSSPSFDTATAEHDHNEWCSPWGTHTHTTQAHRLANRMLQDDSDDDNTHTHMHCVMHIGRARTCGDRCCLICQQTSLIFQHTIQPYICCSFIRYDVTRNVRPCVCVRMFMFVYALLANNAMFFHKCRRANVRAHWGIVREERWAC